jgi:hypothetical protein
MFRKTVFVTLACGFVAVIAVGCAGPMGKGDGDSCSGADDCSSNLTCQPILGRQGDYCCPTPPQTSKESNCQPIDAGTGS